MTDMTYAIAHAARVALTGVITVECACSVCSRVADRYGYPFPLRVEVPAGTIPPGPGEAAAVHAAVDAATRRAQPTVDGYVDGIVAGDPLTLVCRDCGSRHVAPAGQRPAMTILTAGYWFHVCEEPSGSRRCPSCLDAVKAACPSGRCKQ